MMNPRLATLAELCRETALPVSVLAWLAVFGSTGADYSKAAPMIRKAAPIVGRIAPALAANVSAAKESLPQPITFKYTVGLAKAVPLPSQADVATANTSVTETAGEATDVDKEAAQEAAADAAPPAHQADSIVTASLSEPSETLPPATPGEQTTTQAATGDVKPSVDKPSVDTVATLDECYVVDTCVDRYLFALYQRTPKEDSAKESEQKKVTVKRKGKMVTITRTVSTVVDEDFAWKDPKAADKAGMSMMDYVIGGVDRDFKMRLFRMLHAAEEAGLSPGITSAFRDDYRQSIASGLKAANDRSYHGGSFRGGYGHGLAADVVSVNGATRALRQASTEVFWKWIDTHGAEFGIGRPYLDRDPPHVAPIDGLEYATHNPKGRQEAAKRAKLARSS